MARYSLDKAAVLGSLPRVGTKQLKKDMKKTLASIFTAALIAGCGGGGSDTTAAAWHPIWVYDNCIGVTGCAYKTFNTEYSTEAVCLASPEVQNTAGMPFNVRATCYYSE